MVPPGGTQAVPMPPTDGVIGALAIQTTLRFNNDLSLVTVTGENLRQLLEHGVAAVPRVTGRFPQVSGVEFSYDARLPAGSRIVDATVIGTDQPIPLVVDGETQHADMMFRLVTLNVLADGGDGYPFPKGASAERVELPTVLSDPGAMQFAVPGSEQDALAEFPVGGEQMFEAADTPATIDSRIVRLDIQ